MPTFDDLVREGAKDPVIIQELLYSLPANGKWRAWRVTEDGFLYNLWLKRAQPKKAFATHLKWAWCFWNGTEIDDTVQFSFRSFDITLVAAIESFANLFEESRTRFTSSPLTEILRDYAYNRPSKLKGLSDTLGTGQSVAWPFGEVDWNLNLEALEDAYRASVSHRVNRPSPLVDAFNGCQLEIAATGETLAQSLLNLTYTYEATLKVLQA